MEKLACLIVAHNLGDAVIQSGFLDSLVRSGYAEKYLVWTRPQVAFLFKGITNCEVVCSQFPVGTNKQFGGSAFIQFLRAARMIRRRQPSVTIDLIGDLRDRFFARVAGTPKHVYIGWAPDHPFTRLIRNPSGVGKPSIVVPKHIPNVYDAHQLFLKYLVPNHTLPILVRRTEHRDTPKRIGLHPFASQSCKLWADNNWRDLAEVLLDDPRMTVIAFGAPNDREALDRLFNPFTGRVIVVTTDLAAFAQEAANLDVMVGLDSFSVHMAHRQGVRSVLINAGNPREMWAPPDSKMLAKSGSCRYYPCFNIPRCRGTDFENACVNSITPADVVDAIRRQSS